MSIVLTRATKQAARYTDAGGRERCSGCRFFLPQGTCGRIIGPVSPRGWCRFFSMEAVQRWQPQGAIGIGGIGPSLDLDFMNGVMPSGITFTRANTATYFNATGTMQTAATNTPRWDYTGGSLSGLLIEDARTNLLLQSANMANAAWLVANITAAAPVATANQTTAPDGTLTAARVVYPVVSGAGDASILFQGAVATANPYTFSAYMRGNAGGEQLYIIAENSGATVFYKTRVTLTTAWQRVSITTPTLTAAAWNFVIGCDLRDGTQTSIAAQTVFIWGAQVEQSTFASSYIPTTAATVTRAIDVCTIPPANMGWFTSPGGSWMAEFISFTAQAGSFRIVGTAAPGGVSPIYTAPQLSQYEGAGLFNGPTSITLGVVAKGATTLGGAVARECLNGGAIGAAAASGGYSQLLTTGVGFMTTGPAGAAENTTGYMRRMRYWPRILSDAELQSVTT